MTIQQLRYAITISEIGSLNRASEILYISQPSLSSAIRELEKDLGITIFYRGGRGVALTNLPGSHAGRHRMDAGTGARGSVDPGAGRPGPLRGVVSPGEPRRDPCPWIQIDAAEQFFRHREMVP